MSSKKTKKERNRCSTNQEMEIWKENNNQFGRLLVLLKKEKIVSQSSPQHTKDRKVSRLEKKGSKVANPTRQTAASSFFSLLQ
jgi:hypothetical protein